MDIIGEETNLTDLVEVEMLQKIQDAFSMMTGIASLTTDRYGVPVTKGSCFFGFLYEAYKNIRGGQKEMRAV